MKFKIENHKGDVIFSSESPIEVFFAAVAKKHFNVPDSDLEVVAEIGVALYLKADEIDLGHLADYTAENYTKMEKNSVRTNLNNYFNYIGGVTE